MYKKNLGRKKNLRPWGWGTSGYLVSRTLPVSPPCWGQVSPYRDNKPSAFEVEKVGSRDGCGVEQVHRYVLTEVKKLANLIVI